MTRLKIFLLLSLFSVEVAIAQKKPLDHSVYDGWQSIGERLISNDGNWIVYTVNVQEGDNQLIVQSAPGSGAYQRSFPRGYSAVITEDSRFVIFRIKPPYQDTREARIKKKKPDDLPKDSLAILKLGTNQVWKWARVKSFRTPEKSFGWVAYHLEKMPEPVAPKPGNGQPDQKKIRDSLQTIVDSLQKVIAGFPPPGKKKKRDGDGDRIADIGENWSDADGDDAVAAAADAGTTLVLRKLETGVEQTFNNVTEYYFSKNGQRLLIEAARNPKDSLSRPYVLLYDLRKGFGDTLSRGGNDYRNFAMTDDGSQVAYVAERDARPKELQKFYRLWYFREGMDSATILADKNTAGMKLGMTVSEFGTVSFSKSGRRLFFGTAPIQPPRDTTLVDFETAKLDIWHYNDDYLQTVQLNRLKRDLQENFLAVYLFDSRTLRQLGSREIPAIYMTGEGDGKQFVGVTDFGRRVESQWTGNTKKDIYAINVDAGTFQLVRKDLMGVISPSFISPSGRYILWYDSKARQYFAWDSTGTRNITAKIRVPLYDEKNDVPDDPSPYGIMGWKMGDSAVFIYDRYDVWEVDPVSAKARLLAPLNGRKDHWSRRYIKTDPEEKYVAASKSDFLFRFFNENNKDAAIWQGSVDGKDAGASLPEFRPVSYGNPVKAKNKAAYVFTIESYKQSPDLYFSGSPGKPAQAVRLSSINPQQDDYNWGSAQLFRWKTFKGKPSTGILYKPENFDSTRKYPVLIYFYEELSDGLNNYIPPAPTPSRLNISFYVSRGYVVFAPDIQYTIGHPAQSAYDYIVSGAKALTRFKWIDAKNMGIQGQSWGGIQVAQLVTMTDMFKAAWAGAPVANMTSAYGGIRWESGLNRQFQYEKSQSRIGATLWEKPELYIENSPLFHLPKVKTPLVIMSNDADGAVPWYQGIELFTAMRRLGKKVWLLDYNGEAHNLVERRNRKDIQVREQQYFDWLLKGAEPTKWITEGVPAVRKGRDWGLE